MVQPYPPTKSERCIQDEPERFLRFAGLTLDVAGHTLRTDDRDVSLTRGELLLLCALIGSRGRVLTRDQLLDAVAGRRAEPFDRSIDVMIGRLRRKIEQDPKNPRIIVTAVGLGYKFVAPVQAAGAPASAPEANGACSEAVRPAPERRHVTALAAELVAAKGARLPADPEELQPVLKVWRRQATEVVGRYFGCVLETRGRRLLALFGYPVTQEHATQRAISAGLALATREFSDPTAGGFEGGDGGGFPAGTSVRVGVASGLVIAEVSGEVLGEAPEEAERLVGIAGPGQVLVTAGIRRLSGGLFVYRDTDEPSAGGFHDSLHVWHVLGPSAACSRSEALRSDTLTPLVGREEELGALRRAWRKSKTGDAQVVLVSGEPGIGKSRLLAALEAELAHEQFVVFRYFCSPLHQHSPLHPVIVRIEQEAGFALRDTGVARLLKLEAALAGSELEHEDVALIASLLGVPAGERYPHLDLSPMRRRERTLDALYHRLDRVAARQPVLMLFEDAHWADPSSLELLDRVVDRLGRLRILLVISYRPEFAAPWVGRPAVNLIAINRLNQKQSAKLAQWSTADRGGLPAALLGRIVTHADGVPLFIEELANAMLESPAARQSAVSSIVIPSTLHALLMARLDRLSTGKQVAQIGSAIGREFHHNLLTAVTDLPESQVARGLDELLGAGLISCRGEPPDSTYTFKHALVQEAAYQSILKAHRAEVHRAIVAAYERNQTFDVEPGVLAHHCAQAGMIAKAAFHYRIAGERSNERAASVETRAQLGRGLEFAQSLPEGADRDHLEARLLLAFVDVLQLTAGMANPEAGVVLERAIQVCRRLDNSHLLCRALWGHFTHVLVQGDVLAAQIIAEKLLDIAGASSETQASVAARAALGVALFYQGKFENARRHFEVVVADVTRGVALADLDWRTSTAGPAFLALTLACLGYPEQAGRHIRQAVNRAASKGPFARAYSLSVAVRVAIVLLDDAILQELAPSLVRLSEEGGYDQFLAQGRCALGWLQVRQGKVKDGLDTLRGALADIPPGLWVSLPFYRSLLADTLFDDGSQIEAITALNEALLISGHAGDAWFISELHRKRGELLLALPEPDVSAAEAEFQQAVGIARAQCARLFELRAATSLARLWEARDRRAEACDLLAPILSWFTEGFQLPDLSNAKALLIGAQCKGINSSTRFCG